MVIVHGTKFDATTMDPNHASKNIKTKLKSVINTNLRFLYLIKIQMNMASMKFPAKKPTKRFPYSVHVRFQLNDSSTRNVGSFIIWSAVVFNSILDKNFANFSRLFARGAE